MLNGLPLTTTLIFCIAHKKIWNACKNLVPAAVFCVALGHEDLFRSHFCYSVALSSSSYEPLALYNPLPELCTISFS